MREVPDSVKQYVNETILNLKNPKNKIIECSFCGEELEIKDDKSFKLEEVIDVF